MTPSRRRPRRRDQAGYVAILAALFASSVFLGLAALGVDTARWWLVGEQVQRASDAAALAGVTYMPGDLNKARAAATTSATKNGFPADADTIVTVEPGSRPSQLKVTISEMVLNSFGQMFGARTTWVTRSSVSDYTAPAPMGSPCNTFGNEPPSQPVVAGQPEAPPGQPTGSALPTTPFPNCKTTPQFWGAIEGPATDKVQGDRYMTTSCPTTGTYGCTSSKNDEIRKEGYFFSIHVEPDAVNTPIDVQVYDPAFVYTTISCTSLPTSGLAASMNDYTTTDGTDRYGQWKNGTTVTNANAGKYCSGDYNPGASGAPSSPPTTSYAVRDQTDTGDPLKGAPLSGCTKQFKGVSTVPTVASLKKFSSGTTASTTYDRQLARVFHQWVSVCEFTPTRTGDYYLQVRTNVAFGGSVQANSNNLPGLVSSNTAAAGTGVSDTTGVGLNSFSLRAVPQPATSTTKRSLVSVSGYSRMPILQNANSGSVTFNLIKALPATRGQYIAFNFFDAADGATNGGTVKVLPPDDASGGVRSSSGIADCKTAMNDANASGYTALTGCKATVTPAKNNGQVQRMVIPIPTDYNCDPSTLGGCWFSVQIDFTGSSSITDFTTWDADIGGDPVRLIQ